jgi:hypothetical protein
MATISGIRLTGKITAEVAILIKRIGKESVEIEYQYGDTIQTATFLAGEVLRTAVNITGNEPSLKDALRIIKRELDE